MKKIRPFLIGTFILALSFLASCSLIIKPIKPSTSSSSQPISSSNSSSISSSSASSSSSSSSVSSSSGSSSSSSYSHEHTWDKGTITKEATCTVDGEITYNCDGCGETKIETIDATGHKEVVDVAIEPTCTTTGLTEGSHCSVCNDVLVEQKEISAQHIYVNGACELCDATEGLEYNLVNGCYSVSVGKAIDNENIVIPAAYNGLPVTSIEGDAFYYCDSLTSIIIPDSVTSIGSFAFEGCSSLESIIIPDSVTSIDANVFRGCSSLESITIPDSVKSIGDYAFYNCNSLTNITIPNSVKKIGASAFHGCSSLTSITIPEGIRNIEICLFSGCSSLESIIIPKRVTSIGDSSFYGCTSLTSITIPESVTSIGIGAFAGCSSLKSITLPFVGNELNGTTNTNFGYIFGASSYIDNAYYVPSSLKEVTITGGTSIEYYAFAVCRSLESIIIGNSVTSIDDYAFSRCSSLKSITLPFVGNKLNGTQNTHFGYIFGASSYSNSKYYVPSSLKEVTITGGTSIDDYAFDGCNSLTNITIPDSIASIGDYAFQNCSTLTSIIIPNSVTSIGYGAFFRCSSLESITLPFVGDTLNSTTNTHFGYIFGSSSDSYNSIYVPSSLKNVTITGGTSIGYWAFNGCSSLENITIPESITSIGDYAFNGCSSLENIIIPNSVTSIGMYAFWKCGSLKSATIGNSVRRIYPRAFSDCSLLRSIIISNSVIQIDYRAFYNCNILTNVYYTGTEEQWNSIAIDNDVGSLTSATITYNYVSEE